MAVVTLGHNITRVEPFNGAAPGTITSSPGGGPAAAEAAGLQYEGAQALSRRINATGSDHGFIYVHNSTSNLTSAGNTVTLTKIYTVLTDLNYVQARIGSAATAYHVYTVGDDGSLGRDQNFLAPPKGGYLITPIEVQKTAWLTDAIVGSPDITANDAWGCIFNVGTTTGAGLSCAMDAIDITDDGLFLWGGDTAPAGTFQDFLDADEGAGLTGAERVGLWTSQAGVFFVFGKHVIGRTDGGTSTLTEFDASQKTVVFPGGYVSEGFNGFEFDLATSGTIINWTGVTIIGRGRVSKKLYFDTDHAVASNAIFLSTNLPFEDGAQILYSDEGGTEDIGPDDTNGESLNVGSGGPGTGPYWAVSRAGSDDSVTVYPTVADALAATSAETLTASTSGNGENHSITSGPDTRPDLEVTGTAGTSTLLSCILQNMNVITLTSAVTLDSCNLIGCKSLILGGGTIQDCVIDAPSFLSEGQAFMTVTTSADLANVDDNTFIAASGVTQTIGEQFSGHAIEVTTTGTTVGFVGNTFTGYGAGSADDTGAHDNEFDSTSDVNATNDTITVGGDPFATGEAIYYSDEGGSANIGLTDGGLYYVRRDSADTYGIFISRTAAFSNVDRIALTSTGAETQVLYSAHAAFHNSTGGTITLQISGGSNAPSVRNSGGSTTIIENNVSITLTGMKDNTEVRVCDQSGNALDGIEDATAGTTDNRSFTFSLAASTVVDIVIFNTNWILPPNNRIEAFTIPVADASIPISQVFDRNFSNP